MDRIRPAHIGDRESLEARVAGLERRLLELERAHPCVARIPAESPDEYLERNPPPSRPPNRDLTRPCPMDDIYWGRPGRPIGDTP